jgi:hypothetical protein
MHLHRELAVRGWSLLILAALFAGSADAVTVHVKLRSATPLHGTLLAEAADHRAVPVVRAEVIVPSEVAIELPDDARVWTLTAQIKGGWAAPQVVSGSRSEPVIFDVFPTATLEFRPKIPAEARDRPFRVMFQSADKKISGTTECVRHEERVACAIVALPVDVRIAAEGLAPLYLWSIALAAGKTRSEGELAFVAGASLSGYVISENKGDAVVRRTVVELVPDRAARSSDKEKNRAALATQRVQPAKNGFFQFRGLHPGAYVLTAVSGGERSAATKVTILANLEARLKAPLVLQEPFDLHVAITPPMDPWNKPWVIELRRMTGAPNEAEEIARHAANAAGLWHGTGLTVGDYLVSVGRESGAVWLQKEISLNDETRMILPMELVKVSGKVQLGETPLPPGTLVWFRGANGNAAIPVRVREKGEFRVQLPRQQDDLWPIVEVVANEPNVRATFNDVIVKPPDGAEIARVLLQVSDRGVQGRVLDGRGEPVREPAMIYLTRENPYRFLEIAADEAGEFSIHGLEEGTFHLHAATKDAESSSMPVTIEAEQLQAPFVELRLQTRKRLRGVIRSGSGPVAGARVMAMPDDRSTSLLVPLASDAEGRFEVPLNAASAGVTLSVAAPGHAFRFFRTEASSEPLLVNVDPIGGRLILEIPAGDIDKWGGVPVFVRGAAYANLLSIPFHAGERVNRTVDLVTITLPLAEPGEYSICWKSREEWEAITRGLPIPIYVPGRCTSGYLAPFSELRLRAESRRRTANP